MVTTYRLSVPSSCLT
uniref:Uncharacterized protein n=1 Tax=Anguilla anguilla TaxID=7936 RepID=A0A0E9XLZ1_ANGAN